MVILGFFLKSRHRGFQFPITIIDWYDILHMVFACIYYDCFILGKKYVLEVGFRDIKLSHAIIFQMRNNTLFD